MSTLFCSSRRAACGRTARDAKAQLKNLTRLLAQEQIVPEGSAGAPMLCSNPGDGKSARARTHHADSGDRQSCHWYAANAFSEKARVMTQRMPHSMRCACAHALQHKPALAGSLARARDNLKVGVRGEVTPRELRLSGRVRLPHTI